MTDLRVEPYVVAADVYGEPPHTGRGGWTWYTGSAGWMYRICLESVLGLTLAGGDELRVAPCIPDAWPGFTESQFTDGLWTTQQQLGHDCHLFRVKVQHPFHVMTIFGGAYALR